jgi:hypothetical protein
MGTIVLSASVGALVALGMWSLRSSLDARAHGNEPPALPAAARAATTASEKCVPATEEPGPGEGAPSASSDGTAEAAVSASDEPPEVRPVTLDALPVAPLERSEPAPVVTRSVSSRSKVVLARAERNEEQGKTKPAAPAPRSKAPESPRALVGAAIQRSTFAARSCESGPQHGQVAVTFAPSGAVQSVDLLQSFGDVGLNGCVLRAFGRARIPAFEGEPITAKKTIRW